MMLDRLIGFIDRLRMVGLPLSTSEALDAAAALHHVGWESRSEFRTAMASTLVKNATHRPVFDALFDIYFPEGPGQELTPDDEAAPDDMTPDLLEALVSMDLGRLEELAAEAIRRFAGMQPGRPVGGRYHQWKVEQAIGIQALTEQLAGMLGGGTGSSQSGFAGHIAQQDAQARIGELRRRIEKLIRNRLTSERGPEAMARALVRPLPEEVDFLQASSDELAEMRRAVTAMARRLAARLAYKHHHSRRGRLDFRKTIRASLETGGVPVSPRMRHRVHKPELVVLCDISGSVAAFSRFTLALLYALSQQLGRVRSFAFVDTCDEVTDFFKEGDLAEALSRVRKEAQVVWLDGHSDYGHSLKVFLERYADALTPRTTVLVLGDCRNNFHDPHTDLLAEIASRCRRTFILDPEPFRYWDTGDSVVSRYAQVCDAAYECRNLRQLEEFIEKIA